MNVHNTKLNLSLEWTEWVCLLKFWPEVAEKYVMFTARLAYVQDACKEVQSKLSHWYSFGMLLLGLW
jgi:hypothetical protein